MEFHGAHFHDHFIELIKSNDGAISGKFLEKKEVPCYLAEANLSKGAPLLLPQKLLISYLCHFLHSGAF